MTINKAIEFAVEQQEIFSGEMGEFLSQVTEWLEELEELRSCVKSNAFVDGYEKSRLDTIDVLADCILKHNLPTKQKEMI